MKEIAREIEWKKKEKKNVYNINLFESPTSIELLNHNRWRSLHACVHRDAAKALMISFILTIQHYTFSFHFSVVQRSCAVRRSNKISDLIFSPCTLRGKRHVSFEFSHIHIIHIFTTWNRSRHLSEWWVVWLLATTVARRALIRTVNRAAGINICEHLQYNFQIC